VNLTHQMASYVRKTERWLVDILYPPRNVINVTMNRLMGLPVSRHPRAWHTASTLEYKTGRMVAFSVHHFGRLTFRRLG